MTLLNALLSFLRLRDVRDLDPRGRFFQQFRHKAQRFVKGLQVTVLVGGHNQRTRAKRIRGIAPHSARGTLFRNRDGNELSVEV